MIKNNMYPSVAYNKQPNHQQNETARVFGPSLTGLYGNCFI